MSPLPLDRINHNGEDPLHLVTPGKRDVVGIPFNPKVKPFTFGASITKVSVPAKDFKSVRVTFSWPPGTRVECDQVGLLFVQPLKTLPEPSIGQPGNGESAPHYVKFGLEVINGEPIIAVAGSNHQLDWSTWPTGASHLESITIEFLRYNDSLLARLIETDGGRAQNIRLMTWPFATSTLTSSDCWVGIYISRPDTNNTTDEAFAARFRDFRIETVSGTHL